MKKKKEIKREVIVSADGGLVKGILHREDFDSCPNGGCDFKADDHWGWDKHCTVFITGEVQCKHEQGAFISECPKCFDKSWVHCELDINWRDGFPEHVKKAAREELMKRKLIAAREWGSRICWKCKNLEAATVTTHAWRSCSRGMGPAERECPQFVPIDHTIL